jgi:acetylornithine deacetylase
VHLDTVPAAEAWSDDPFTLRVDAGRAIGLGACDIKGAAAALLAAAATTSGPAAILLTTDEEAGTSRCVRAFCDDPPPFVERVIVAEPTGVRAVTAHRGLVSAEVRFEGRAGHASAAGGDDHSAVHAAMHWGAGALERAAAFEAAGGLRFNIGKIGGGTKANVVAADAALIVGFRPPARVDVDEAIEMLRGPLAAEAWHTRFLAPALAPTDASTELAATLDVEAGPPVDFWTEAALFAGAGLPAVVLGPGDIAQAHAADEWIALDQLVRAAETYAGVLGTTSHAPPPLPARS